MRSDRLEAQQMYVSFNLNVAVKHIYSQVQHFYNGLVLVHEDEGKPWKVLEKSGATKFTVPIDMKPKTH
jgi:hypothetical protein